MFLLFNSLSLNPIRVSKKAESSRLSAPISEDVYVAIINDPFSIKNYVLNPKTLDVLKISDLIKLPNPLYPMQSGDTADAVLTLTGRDVSLSVSGGYPTEEPLSVVILHDGDPFSPVDKFIISPGQTLNRSYQNGDVKSFQLFVVNPFQDFTYGYVIT